MTKASDNVYPRFLISEGGSTSTPSAGRVTAYAKADGLLYSKDDAGTEKLLSSGPAAGISSGTSNPAGPTTGDLFFRTDLGYIVSYTGAAWHTVQEFSSTLGYQDIVAGAANSHTIGYFELDNATYDLYVTRIACSTTVATTNDGSKFWTVAFTREPSATSLGSFSTGTTPDTAGLNTRHDVAVGALTGTTDRYIRGASTKTSTPGVFYGLVTIFWRKVIT